MNNAPGTGWWREAGPQARRALVGAGAGWTLDAFDVMLYTFALGQIRAEFGLDDAGAGALMAATLVASACGGIAAGALADRFGRVRVLMASVLTYSVFTALSATARNVPELVLWRVLVGLGMGAEWSAGSVLVAEAWPSRSRGRAIGFMQSGWAIGYMLAAVVQATVLEPWGWRALFLTGIVPGLLVLWLRRNLHEPEAWAVHRSRTQGWSDAVSVLGRQPYLGRAVIAASTATALLMAYWGFVTWLPAFLARPIELGGAGLGAARSTPWLITMQAGAFLGYTTFGVLADRFGRKSTFVAFALAAATLVPVYGLMVHDKVFLFALGPLVGFVGHGYFSVFGAMLAELFPTSARATAQGLCYNVGRGVGAASPWIVGALADRRGLPVALALTSVLYVAGTVLVLLLPETRGTEIE